MATNAQHAVHELQELWRELAALELAYLSKRVCFYKPIGHQAEFHAAGDAPVRLVLGSNRSGKTVAGVVETIAHALGYRPWLPEDHPDRVVRLLDGEPIPVPNVGRIIAQNYQQAINQTIWPKLEEWAPMGWYTVKRDNRGIPVEMRWRNGSVIYFMSDDQDDMAFEGPNGHYWWGDEPFGYRKFVGLKRGLIDFAGHAWMTMTPLSQPWISDVLISRANEADNSVRLFKFSIWDNCIDNGGYLRREDIEEFLKNLREDELEARLHGNPLHLAGRVYKEWEPEPPYWVEPFKIPDTWPRICVIDPHPRKPVAVLWAAMSPDSQLIIYRSLFDPNLTTIAQVADRIKELEGWRPVDTRTGLTWRRTATAEPVAYRIIDSSAQEQERTSGSTVRRRFQEAGIQCELARKQNAQAGYDAIHEALRFRADWHEPMLVIFNTCVEVKRNFQNFCWDDWATSKQRDLRGERQEVRKTEDDFIDCIRYIYQSGVTYQMLARFKNRVEAEADVQDYSGFNLVTREYLQAKKKGAPWPTYSGSNPRHGSNYGRMT